MGRWRVEFIPVVDGRRRSIEVDAESDRGARYAACRADPGAALGKIVKVTKLKQEG